MIKQVFIKSFSERLQIYKNAISAINRFMKSRTNGDFYGHGLCFAVAELHGNDHPLYPNDGEQMKVMYPEMYKMRPKNWSGGGYWYEHVDDPKGKVRITILKQIIAKMEKSMPKERLAEFVDKFATRAYAREDSATTELMMDDHTYIMFQRKGYYLPENNSLFTPLDEETLEYLNQNYHI